MAKVFCLEGEWEQSIHSRDSVLPLLELLDRLGVAGYFHRSVATRKEFTYHLNKFLRLKASTFPVLYLAGHGFNEHGEAGIALSIDEEYRVSELGRMMEDRLAGKVLYFGSCLVGSAEDAQLKSLAKTTGARAIVGYETEVDWLESASFDLLLLANLVEGRRSDTIFRDMAKGNQSLAEVLGLVVATKTKVTRARS